MGVGVTKCEADRLHFEPPGQTTGARGLFEISQLNMNKLVVHRGNNKGKPYRIPNKMKAYPWFGMKRPIAWNIPFKLYVLSV